MEEKKLANDVWNSQCCTSVCLEADPHVVLDKLMFADPVVVLGKLMNEDKNSAPGPGRWEVMGLANWG